MGFNLGDILLLAGAVVLILGGVDVQLGDLNHLLLGLGLATAGVALHGDHTHT